MGHPVCLGHTPRASHCWSPASWPCKDPGSQKQTSMGQTGPGVEGGKASWGEKPTGSPKCRRLQRGEKRGPGPALPHRASGVQQSPCQAWTPPSTSLPESSLFKCKPDQASLLICGPQGGNQEKRASPTITVNDSKLLQTHMAFSYSVTTQMLFLPGALFCLICLAGLNLFFQTQIKGL